MQACSLPHYTPHTVPRHPSLCEAGGKKKTMQHFILFGFKDQLVISKTKSFSQGKDQASRTCSRSWGADVSPLNHTNKHVKSRCMLQASSRQCQVQSLSGGKLARDEKTERRERRTCKGSTSRIPSGTFCLFQISINSFQFENFQTERPGSRAWFKSSTCSRENSFLLFICP